MSLLDKNTNMIRKAFDAFNTGNLNNIEEFISSDYINHEALDNSSDRANLNGPDEFRNLFDCSGTPSQIFTLKKKRSLPQKIRSLHELL
ncbi:MAG: hypothetical protein WBZ36_13945 [Candidatus Nitrosopolaris sp.]